MQMMDYNLDKFKNENKDRRFQKLSPNKYTTYSRDFMQKWNSG